MFIPLALLLVNFFGFTYAHYAKPLRAARTPYVRAEPAGPLLPAYRDYLQSLLTRDLSMRLNLPGNSRSAPAQFGETLVTATQASFGLLLIALTLSGFFGVLLGLAAVRTDPPGVARWLTGISAVGLAMPSFYIGSLFIIVSVYFLITGGPDSELLLPLSGFGWDKHLVLPVLALMARPTVQLAQVIASLLSAELSKQYVVAARAFGNPWRVVRNHHALRNALPAILLTFAGLLRLVMGELVLVEWLFRWNGLGRLLAWTLVPAQLTNSSGSPLFLNPPVVAAVLTIIAALFLLADFVAAVLVRRFDPRLREGNHA
ncbi:MAG: hypothetical protein OHK0052_25080 [Anaerolineales bacterium]